MNLRTWTLGFLRLRIDFERTASKLYCIKFFQMLTDLDLRKQEILGVMNVHVLAFRDRSSLVVPYKALRPRG